MENDNIPVPVSGNTNVAPKILLQLSACGCQGDEHCANNSTEHRKTENEANEKEE